MAVLIVSMPNDLDAYTVKWAINKLGVECDIFYSADLAGGAEWSFDPDNNFLETEFRGKTNVISFGHYDSVWMRRPCSVVPREQLTDIDERAAAEAESTSLLSSVTRHLEEGKFVANSLTATRVASNKAYQFRIAREVGLPMPATVISNSPERIMKFFNDWSGKIIYKPLVLMLWSKPGKGATHVPTSIIDDSELLSSSDLKSAPGIYQQIITKTAEIRVTILGKSVFALEKRFPNRQPTDLHVDWRAMHTGAVYLQHILPDEIIQKSSDLLQRLGLVMGCFDFIIDTNGNYYFLEVNPQGQFLWGDQVCSDFNQLEAMAEFLISKDANFIYSRKDKVSFSQFHSHVNYGDVLAYEKEFHFGDLLSFRYGSITHPQIKIEPLPDSVIKAYTAEKINALDKLKVVQEK